MLTQKKLLYLKKDWLSGSTVTKVTALGCKTWTADPHSFSVSDDGLFATFLQYQDPNSCFDHDSVFVVSFSTPEQSHRVSLFRNQQGAENTPWNPRILSISWGSQTSSSLYVIIYEDGNMPVWKIDISQDDGKMGWKGLATPVLQNGCVSSLFTLTRREGQERILVVRSTFDRAGIVEIIAHDADYQTGVRLIAEHCVPSSSAMHEKNSFQGAEARISAFIQKPGHFVSGKKYPVIIILHGGPNDAWRDCWPKFWNPLVWTDQGYVVITPNISGSTGYGVSFATSIYQDWGGRTLTDLECLFSHMETSMPFVDLSRVIGAGYSFGGYMMNWIAGNRLSTRFCALIVHAGLYSTRNLMSGDFPVNASRLCQNWKTPMFFSHGEIDYRIPISESLSAYNTCQVRGVPSQVLVFPDEGHTISRPENLAQWYKTTVQWAGRWVGHT
ncbi:hypothetical protein COCHEDRAFT_1159594 [Bipolaris maydis C5]|uniref:Dipeptidyl-peptidase V n=2 Tax=Cochliobolus heterostrophus TaxID=5016 RepID=M2UH53_COCH5|nr:hypothetical protein COCHEDRAFT_1159594 [Bipolaris maydis C5]